MGAYETWQEARARLAKEPDSEHLQAVVDYLQPAALEDYLEQFVGEHAMYAEEVTVSADAVPAFLAGLDELRVPSQVELEIMRQDLARNADAALDSMKRLNWTGEHTYGEAIDDARAVLREVMQGKAFPKLERFRCPSIFQIKEGKPFRCEMQLPHEGQHKYGSAGWTDEQSVNPPKPYDEPERSTCPSEYGPVGARVRCQLDPGHEGQHQHAMFQWGDDEAGDRTSLPKQCGAYWMDIRCELTRGHSEPHCGGKASWPHDYSTIVPVSDGGGA